MIGEGMNLTDMLVVVIGIGVIIGVIMFLFKDFYKEKMESIVKRTLGKKSKVRFEMVMVKEMAFELESIRKKTGHESMESLVNEAISIYIIDILEQVLEGKELALVDERNMEIRVTTCPGFIYAVTGQRIKPGDEKFKDIKRLSDIEKFKAKNQLQPTGGENENGGNGGS